jgi:SHS2 domain-containing protein
VPYRFLDDAPTADVGFVASGDTLAACFQAAADATLEVMVANPGTVEAHENRTVHIEADVLDLALLRFLEELIFYKDAESLFLRATRVDVMQRAGRWAVDASLAGEPIDPLRHQLSSDVKAVTVHRLSVRQTAAGWEATVVLDI